MTNFNYTEEAFLLSSLQEVTKIWAKGTGEASFNLNILDGVAELQLHFKLGSPCDPHCVPADPPDPGQSFPQEDQNHLAIAARKDVVTVIVIFSGPKNFKPCKQNHLQKELQLQMHLLLCSTKRLLQLSLQKLLVSIQ